MTSLVRQLFTASAFKDTFYITLFDLAFVLVF